VPATHTQRGGLPWVAAWAPSLSVEATATMGEWTVPCGRPSHDGFSFPPSTFSYAPSRTRLLRRMAYRNGAGVAGGQPDTEADRAARAQAAAKVRRGTLASVRHGATYLISFCTLSPRHSGCGAATAIRAICCGESSGAGCEGGQETHQQRARHRRISEGLAELAAGQGTGWRCTF
jgi:hypothetical protein